MLPKIKVLIVDDEVEFTEVLSRRLRRFGLAVRTAANGNEAFAALEEGPCDVVVLDVNLPELSGLEVLKVIRKNFDKVQVLLLTGDGDMTKAMRCLKDGAYDFLHKPVPAEELRDRILSAVRAGMP